jgi:ParB-like chromosome segregation protein Spo0J
MGTTGAEPATRTRAKAKGKGKGNTVQDDGRRLWPYRFEMVPLEALMVDERYQRPLTNFVDTVAREYDPALVGTLIVSERPNGKMAVIDGQTRMEGMRANGETAAPCLVYSDLTRAQEAQLFSDLQTKRRGMATYLRFRAALVAEDEEAMGIAAIVREAGFELDVEETAHTIKAISALERVYRRDPALLVTVMAVIAAAWPDPNTEARASADIIGGLAAFLARERKVDVERLRDRLAATEPRTIRHRAGALQEGAGGGGGRAGYMADAILGIYMRGRARGGAS